MNVNDFTAKCASCLKKQADLVELFSGRATMDEKYQLLIDFGKKQSSLSLLDKNENTRVEGCQSLMYLKVWMSEGLIYFQTEADALISAGLGELLRAVYSGEPAEVVLACPLTFLEKIGLSTSLSPSRMNGLASLVTKLRKETMGLLS